MTRISKQSKHKIPFLETFFNIRLMNGAIRYKTVYKGT